MFFSCFLGSGGSKSRLAKAAGAEPSGEMRDEKLHSVVARSTCRSQNGKRKSLVGAFLEVEIEMFKECMVLWREAGFQVTMVKTRQYQSRLRS